MDQLSCASKQHIPVHTTNTTFWTKCITGAVSMVIIYDIHTILHNIFEVQSSYFMQTMACVYYEVRASQLAQASERVGSLIPASQQG